MAKPVEKIKAQKLRKQGLSIKDISKVIEVSPSSVSIWCREIILSPSQNLRLRSKMISSGSKGRMIGTQKNKQKKKEIITQLRKEAKNEVGQITKRERLLIITALYWAEGSKSDSSTGFLFVNSDPEMIKLVHLFLTKDLEIPRDEIKVNIQINEIHKPRIESVLNFWSTLLQLPRTHIGRTYFVRTKTKKVYSNFDTYYGVLRLGISKSSILKYRIISLIEAIKPG